MASDPPAPLLLEAPLIVAQLRRAGDRVVLEFAPEGQSLLSSAIQVAAADQTSRLHKAWIHHFLDSWTSLLGDFWKLQADLPAGPRLASEGARLLEHVRSDLETFAEQQREVELEQLQRRHSAHLREAAASVERLTAEETEADRALCAMLEIEPDALPDDSLDELRHLWA